MVAYSLGTVRGLKILVAGGSICPWPHVPFDILTSFKACPPRGSRNVQWFKAVVKKDYAEAELAVERKENCVLEGEAGRQARRGVARP